MANQYSIVKQLMSDLRNSRLAEARKKIAPKQLVLDTNKKLIDGQIGLLENELNSEIQPLKEIKKAGSELYVTIGEDGELPGYDEADDKFIETLLLNSELAEIYDKKASRVIPDALIGPFTLVAPNIVAAKVTPDLMERVEKRKREGYKRVISSVISRANSLIQEAKLPCEDIITKLKESYSIAIREFETDRNDILRPISAENSINLITLSDKLITSDRSTKNPHNLVYSAVINASEIGEVNENLFANLDQNAVDDNLEILINNGVISELGALKFSLTYRNMPLISDDGISPFTSLFLQMQSSNSAKDFSPYAQEIRKISYEGMNSYKMTYLALIKSEMGESIEESLFLNLDPNAVDDNLENLISNGIISGLDAYKFSSIYKTHYKEFELKTEPVLSHVNSINEPQNKYKFVYHNPNNAPLGEIAQIDLGLIKADYDPHIVHAFIRAFKPGTRNYIGNSRVPKPLVRKILRPSIDGNDFDNHLSYFVSVGLILERGETYSLNPDVAVVHPALKPVLNYYLSGKRN